jgi:hypothetical protein
MRRQKDTKKFLRLVFLITNDHCNLNCAGCDGFSALGKPGFISVESFEKTVKRLAELLDIGLLCIIGGEPLLHPQIEALAVLTRKYFPKSDVQITTNGILLLSRPESFWGVCAENKIAIDVSHYPIGLKTKTMRDLAKAYSVVFRTTQIKHFSIPMDLKGNQGKDEAFKVCRSEYNFFCPIVRKGRIYHCSRTAFIELFNNHFGKKLPVPQGIDIFNSVISGEEIRDIILHRPVELCKYCCINNVTMSWHRSKKEISEWTI